MIRLGLTGSVGMGKSTVARQFAQFGVPVFDADLAVKKLLEPGEAGFAAVQKYFPKTVTKNTLDKKALGDLIFNDTAAREKLESLLHPLVHKAEDAFLKRAYRTGANLAVLDIPLLFETAADLRMDVNLVVTAPYFIQKKRVLSRPGMSEKRFHAILKNQMPDREKRKLADFVVHTGLGKGYAFRQIKTIYKEFIRARNSP